MEHEDDYDPQEVVITCPNCDEEELRLQPHSDRYYLCGSCEYEEWR